MKTDRIQGIIFQQSNHASVSKSSTLEHDPSLYMHPITPLFLIRRRRMDDIYAIEMQAVDDQAGSLSAQDMAKRLGLQP